MIICNLENAHFYESLNPHFKDVFSCIANTNYLENPIPVQTVNDVCTIQLQEFTSQGTENPRYEYHKDYIDIHYTLSGTECVGFAGYDSTFGNVIQPYNSTDDIEFLYIPGTVFPLLPGEMAIVFPGEIHAPKAHSESGQSVIKLVVKVPMV